jgi:hypothetical protein
MKNREAVDRFCEKIGSDTFEALRERLRHANAHIAERGLIDYAGRRLLTGYSNGEFYDWDLYFENLYLSYYGISKFCRTNIEVFLDRQLENGFTSRTLIEPRHHQHFKPFLAQLVLLDLRQTGDTSWFDGPLFERLVRYLDYWMWYCDLDKNGLCVWDSADHSGMDNQMTRAGVYGSWTVEGTDLNCYLVREMKAMAVLADRIGRPEMGASYRKMEEKIWRAIDAVLWDEKDGFYYDRNERTGKSVRIKSIAGLIPLWLRVMPPAKAARLVQEHLLNTQEFWLEFPVAAWSKQEPDYDQDAKDWGCNWRGTTWIPTNYLLMHGLMHHGYQDAALDLAYRTFHMALSRNSVTREYYNAETGAGKGLDPFWGWSCLAYFMPLECEMGYHPDAINEEPIVPLAHELGIEFPALPQQTDGRATSEASHP